MAEAKTTKAPAAKKAAAPKAATKAAKPAASGKKLKITQIKSAAGRIERQHATLKGLGLNKIRRSKILVDTPEIRGMIEAVKHLVKVEDAA